MVKINWNLLDVLVAIFFVCICFAVLTIAAFMIWLMLNPQYM